MTTTPATEMPVPQPRRPPMYFPGNHEDPPESASPPSAELSFRDLLDAINPLQQIPIVSTIYRAITGDTISTGSRIAGGMLYGGPIGALIAGVTGMLSEISGGSPETHLLAMAGRTPESATKTPAPVVATAHSDLGPGADTLPAAAPPAAAPATAPAASPADAATPLLARASEDSPATSAEFRAVEPPAAERRAADPVPSELFLSLQSPARGMQGAQRQDAPDRPGRDIRSYLAEAMPASAPSTRNGAAAEAAAPATAEAAGGAVMDDADREAARAAVAAAHARGIEVLRRQSLGDGAPADIPLAGAPAASFPDLMMRGLEKYRESSRLGSLPGATVGSAG